MICVISLRLFIDRQKGKPVRSRRLWNILSLPECTLVRAQTFRSLNSKILAENKLDFLEGQPSRLRVAEDTKRPSEEAQAGIETERARRGDGIHKGQVCKQNVRQVVTSGDQWTYTLPQ